MAACHHNFGMHCQFDALEVVSQSWHHHLGGKLMDARGRKRELEAAVLDVVDDNHLCFLVQNVTELFRDRTNKGGRTGMYIGKGLITRKC